MASKSELRQRIVELEVELAKLRARLRDLRDAKPESPPRLNEWHSTAETLVKAFVDGLKPRAFPPRDPDYTR